MTDKQARTLAALGIAALDLAVVYGVAFLLGYRLGWTTCLVVFGLLYVFVQWVLDRLAANNPDDHDS